MLRFRVPLAWCNLTHDKRRFAVCVLGITFAIVLMFVQMGFLNALLDSSVLLLEQFNAEVVIVSKARYALAVQERFTTRRLEQAKSLPGVAAAFPVYMESQGAMWQDTEGGATRFDRDGEPSKRAIRVLAFNPDHAALRSPEIQSLLPRLRTKGTVLVDLLSKPDFGTLREGISRELAGHSVQVVGTFSLGTDFTSDGTVITSDQTYYRLLSGQLPPASPMGMADFGLVQVREGYSPEDIRNQLTALLPDDVLVMTLADFSGQERAFWRDATPIGPIFMFGFVMGFLVGLVICFQILSADVADHMKEYATLKAIGYTNGYLSRVVLAQALWLSLLAFGPAMAISLLLYQALVITTGLPMYLNVSRCAIVFVSAAAMCINSGLIAIQKIKTADPAEVF
jgi:putative ABC transport system permease protein